MSDLGWGSAELQALEAAARRLEEGFAGLPDRAGSSGVDTAAMRAVLLETAERLQDNYPYFHPRYAGQMIKPPHPVARLAYALAMLINPNNHALDGGRASSAMEQEAVAALAAMFGWPQHLGHLTGGGTLANLEALWVAGRLAPGQTVVASAAAHYTQERLSGLLGLPFETVAVDGRGRMDISALEARLGAGGVGTVVATAGTTALGAVDPVADIVELRRQFGFRLHVDAAYGGYFTLSDQTAAEPRRNLGALRHADSLVVDPHKHGLQPYGCGAVLFADPVVARLYRHDSPYTYFTAAELHLGEISLECSRAGAAAVALWATQRLLPPVPGGDFAAGLSRSLQAAAELHRRLQLDPRFLTLPEPDLDIVIWAPAPAPAAPNRAQDRPAPAAPNRAPDTAATSTAARRVFDAAAQHGLHLALVQMDAELLAPHWPDVAMAPGERVTCLRSCLMKPEHLDWLDDLWRVLDQVC